MGIEPFRLEDELVAAHPAHLEVADEDDDGIVMLLEDVHGVVGGVRLVDVDSLLRLPEIEFPLDGVEDALLVIGLQECSFRPREKPPPRHVSLRLLLHAVSRESERDLDVVALFRGEDEVLEPLVAEGCVIHLFLRKPRVHRGERMQLLSPSPS
jgi:hypothetical protein